MMNAVFDRVKIGTESFGLKIRSMLAFLAIRGTATWSHSRAEGCLEHELLDVGVPSVGADELAVEIQKEIVVAGVDVQQRLDQLLRVGADAALLEVEMSEHDRDAHGLRPQ